MAIADSYRVNYHEDDHHAPAKTKQGAGGSDAGDASSFLADTVKPTEEPGKYLDEQHADFVANGYRIPQVPTAPELVGDTRESDEVAAIMGTRPIDRLNADFLKAIEDPSIRSDETRLFDTCDKYLDLIGIPSHHGNTLNSQGGNAEYKNALALADDVKRMINEGYKSVLDPSYVQTMDALDALEPNDRDGMAKVLGVKTDEIRTTMGYSPSITGGGMSFENARRADADIDADIDSALNKLYAKNYKALYSYYRKFLDERGERVLRDSIRNGTGLSLSAKREFELICTTDRQQAKALKFLMEGASVNVPSFWLDTGVGVAKQARDLLEGHVRYMDNEMHGLFHSEDKKPLYDLSNYLMKLSEYAEATPEDKAALERMTQAAWDSYSLLSPEDRNIERANELAMRRFTERQAYTGYNMFEKSLMGFIEMPIYMAWVGLPGGGIQRAMTSHFDNVSDAIIEQGGDPAKVGILRLGMSAVWAGIEQWLPEHLLGKSLTNLEKKVMLDKARAVSEAMFKATKRKMLKYDLQELSAKQIQEVFFEEAPQDVIESLETDLGLDKEGREMFWNAVRAYGRSAVESFGPILPWSAIGTARAHHRVHRKMLDSEDVRSFYVSVSRMNNQVRGEVIHDTANAQTPERKAKREQAKAKRVGRYVNRALEIWEKHETKGDAAAEIESALGLSPDAVNSLTEVFMMRDRILKDAEGNADRTTAYRDALIAHGLDPNLAVLMAGNDAGRHGAHYAAGSDTSYDPVRHFQRLLPGAKVETVTLAGDDPGAAPKEGARPTHGVKVTIPVMGADGKTHDMSFIAVEKVPENINIDSDEFASSVANSTHGKVTAEQYMAMSHDQRVAFLHGENTLGENGHGLALTTSGNFDILDADGNTLFDTDGIINMLRGKNPLVHEGGNWTLSHESGHGIIRFARKLGAFGDEKTGMWTNPTTGKIELHPTVALMRTLFGDPDPNVDELWNEEPMMDGLADWFGRVQDEVKLDDVSEKTVWESVFGAVGRFFRGFHDPAEGTVAAENAKKTKEQAREAVYEALRKGDFSGLDAFADIKFEEDEKPQNGATAQNAQEQPSTASEGKTGDEPSATDGRAPAATAAANPSNGAATEQQNAAEERVKANKKAENAKKNAGLKRTSPGKDVPEDIQAKLDMLLNRLAAVEGMIQAGLGGSVAAGLPLRTGKKARVWSPGFTGVDVEYEIIDLDDIVDAFGDFQIRDRKGRLATEQQVYNVTRPGVWHPEVMFDSVFGDAGSPILVGGNMEIQGLASGENVANLNTSGNGRKLFLKQLVKEGRFEKDYGEARDKWCAEHGITFDKSAYAHPVLVRRIVGGLKTRADLVKFCDECNEGKVLELSEVEQALKDLKRIDPAIFKLYEGTRDGNLIDPNSKSFNDAFFQSFFKAVGSTGLTDAQGYPTDLAQRRMMNALVAYLFGVSDDTIQLVTSLMESKTSLGLGRLYNALASNAADLIATESDPRHRDYAITRAVREAAKMYITWRYARRADPKLDFNTHLTQLGFGLNGEGAVQTPTIVKELAKLLEAERFGGVLKEYRKLAAQQPSAEEIADSMGLLSAYTPEQLLAMAERNLYKSDLVTPDPQSDEVRRPVPMAAQTAPAVSAKPTKAEREAERKEAQSKRDAEMSEHLAKMTPEERADYEAVMAQANTMPKVSEKPSALDVAQNVLAPKPPEKFVPVPAQRGTAELPGASAEGIEAYEVDANGNPSTPKKQLPSGAYNHLRSPYAVKRPPKPSAQDLAGRGLGIGQPHPTRHNDIFPKFQGYKKDMADRTTQALHKCMSKAEREHYTTVVDYFGGGGCWGLYLALENFPNAKNLVINEFDADRIEKIRILQEMDGAVADEAEAILREPNIYSRIIAKKSSSGSTIAGIVERKLLDGEEDVASLFGDDIKKVIDPHQRAVLRAFVDCGQQLIATVKDKNGNPINDGEVGLQAVLDQLKSDGEKAKAAADEFKARGGSISYRQGDAASFADAPSGDSVVAVCDPPYYLTTDYKNNKILGLDLVPDNWSYEASRRLLHDLAHKGDAIVYTDEAWWHKETYQPGQNFKREQELLLDIINTLDHFDVAGRVGSTFSSRQEVLGIHHGHKSDSAVDGNVDAGAEGGSNANDALSSGAADGRGDRGARSSVRPVAGVAEGEGGRLGGTDSDGGREGGVWNGGHFTAADRAIAREVVIADIERSAEAAGLPVTPYVADVIRYSVRQVRDERLADYARLVSANAREWLTARRKELRKRMRAAGYTDLVWHGTYGDDFNVFRFGDNNGHGVKAAYFTYRRQTAQNYAAIRGMDAVLDGGYDLINTRRFFVNPGKVYEYDEAKTPLDFDGFVAMLKKAYADGYDSVRCHNVLDDQGARLDTNDENMTFLEPEDAAGNGEGDFFTDTLIVFDREGNPGANRIKAADAVTFDNGGLPIPPDMRADEGSPDVRYSVTVEDREHLKASFRNANGVEEAGRILREAGIIGKPLTNAKLGMTVTISGNDLSKMMSEKATRKSVSARLHALAVANADSIFEAAFVDATHPDTHGRREVIRTHRLGSALYDAEYERYEPVLITVLEYLRDGTKMYSIEAIDLAKYENSAGQLVAVADGERQTPIAEFVDSIAQSVAEVNRDDPRFSVKAVGKYAGELRRMAWGLKLGQHRAMEDAARMMSPLIPENAVIVPMPNHEGKPISTMILAYYISGQEDKGIDIVPALEAEPHESNYKHKKRTKGKSTAIVMHRTDAEIPSGRPVVIIDNVVASGATYKAAQKVLPEADLVTLADATRGRVDFDPSLQDLQKRMAENPGNLAASLNAALANPAKMDAEYAAREWGSQRIEREASAYADLVNGTRYSLGTRYADRTAYDEDEVRRLAAAGDIDAIAEYFVRNEQMLLSQVRRYGKDLSATDAEDILSSVREGVIRKYVYEGGVPDVPFGAVVVTRIKHLALKTLRGNAGSVRSREMLTNDKPLGDDAEGDSFIDQTPTQDRTWGGEEVHNHSREEAHRRVEEFLSHYSGEKADIFRERTLEGKSVLKISRQRGIPEDVVESIVEGMIAEWTSGEYKKLTPASNSGSSEVVSGGRRESGHKTTSFATQDAVIKVHWKIAKKLENCTDYQQIVAKMLLNGMSYAEIAEKTATKYNSVAHALYEVTRSTGIRFGNKRSDATGTKIPARVQQVFDYFGQHPDATQREVADALGMRPEKVSLAVRDGIRLGLGDNRVRQNRMMDRMQTVVKMADEGLGVAEIADKMGITVESVRRLGDRARADLGWAGEITTRRTEFAPRHSLRVVEREFDEDTFNAMAGVGGIAEEAPRAAVRARTSLHSHEDLAVGLIGQRLLAGKETKPEYVSQLLNSLGVKDVNAADAVTKAEALVEKRKTSAKGRINAGDPSLMTDLATEAMKSRVSDRLMSAYATGAADMDPELGRRVQEAIMKRDRRMLDSVTGYTSAEICSELFIDPSEALLLTAEFEKTPEEKAKAEAEKAKREEEKKRREEAEAELEGEDNDDAPEKMEVPANIRATVDSILEGGRARQNADQIKELRKRLEAKRKAEERGEDADDGAEADDTEDGGGVGEGEGASAEDFNLAAFNLIKPIFISNDDFSYFLIELMSRKLSRKYPELGTTDEMWKNPIAVKELQRTAQHILAKMAHDTLGVSMARAMAMMDLTKLTQFKKLDSTRKWIAHVYGRIHEDALRLSRRQLVKELIRGNRKKGLKGIRQYADTRGRFSSTREDLKRKIDAKTELFCRRLIPYLTMSEEKLSEEITFLKGRIAELEAEAQDTGASVDNDSHYNEARDKLALAEKYGGMIRWMPADIVKASAEIRELLDGRLQDFEERREERKQQDAGLANALMAAMAHTDKKEHKILKIPGVGVVAHVADSLIGNLEIELRNMFRYCTDETLRGAALDAVEDIMYIVSRGTEQYNVAKMDANAEVNAMLKDCYGNADKGLAHLNEELPEEVARQFFKQKPRSVFKPTYAHLLQLYASCIQYDYRDNVQEHGRADQIEAMANALSAKDLAFHAATVNWYAKNRQALSEANEEITGLPVESPDRLYVPVRTKNFHDDFNKNAKCWGPVPKALTRRTKHDKDFNEGVSFLDMISEGIETRAQLIGYGMAGIRLREILATVEMRETADRHGVRKDLERVIDHVQDVLMQGMVRKQSTWLDRLLNWGRRNIAKMALSWNAIPAIKQLASMPVWANLDGVGFHRQVHYLTDVSMDALDELRQSDGYRSRYILGWSEATRNILRHPSKKWNLYGRYKDAGMFVNKDVDKISCLWMAQGYYRDQVAKYLDRGFSEEEAKKRAATMTWARCEQGQQSGRIENMNAYQRNHGEIAAALFQFLTAPLLQANYEYQAIKECAAGTPGAKGRLLRALIINHILVPGFMEAVNLLWNCICGQPPEPDDEEWRKRFATDVGWNMLLGSFAPLYIVPRVAEGIFDKVTGRKGSKYSRRSTAAEQTFDIMTDCGKIVIDLGQYGLQEWTDAEFEDEVTLEKLQKEIDSVLRVSDALYRQGRRIYKGWTEDR